MAPHGLLESVQLGFPAEKASEEFNSTDCTQSKIGGRPVWLDRQRLPSPNDLACGVCERPMSLLLQIYTPESNPECFHRSVYVFCCKTNACHKQPEKCFRVLSCQLAEDNPFWTSEGDWCGSASLSLPKFCVVCGAAGPKTCGKCHRAFYCSREHQTSHWTLEHKEQCGKPDDEIEDSVRQRLNRTHLFPQRKIVMDDEDVDEAVIKDANDFAKSNGEDDEDDDDDDDDMDEENNVDKRMDQLQLHNQANREEFEKEVAPEYQKPKEDPAFLAFQRRIMAYPNQILRYPVPEDDNEISKPLWVSSEQRVDLQQISPCPCCHQPRTFEFQIMSQLLLYLSIDDTVVDSMDWGTLLIFTCKQRCSFTSSSSAYRTELIHRQNFSAIGAMSQK